MREVKVVTAEDIALPEAMMKNVGVWPGSTLWANLLAAMAWLANNPVQFSDAELSELNDLAYLNSEDLGRSRHEIVNEVQRRLFLRKEAPLPDAVKALMPQGEGRQRDMNNEEAAAAIAQAYALGKAEKESA